MSNGNTTNSPSVFRGGCKMASTVDIQNLSTYFLDLIAGVTNGTRNELGENGYIPWKFRNDGSVDIETLFPELVEKFNEEFGLKISNEGVYVVDGINSINFTGKYVSMQVDDENNLVLNIDEPNDAISRFNQASLLSNALVKITSDVLEDVIIPDVTATPDYQNQYGSWLAGEKHKAVIKKRDLYDWIELETQGPAFASSKNTYFEVKILDAYDNVKDSFISKNITGNTSGENRLDPANSAGTSSSVNIKIYISEFKEETRGYSFKSRFKIDLAAILNPNIGGRFRIVITHKDDVNNYVYTSDDMLYVINEKPIISNGEAYVVTDEASSGNAKYIWSSGIKYMKSGNIVYKFNVNNLNKMAAIEDKFQYKFGCVNQDAVVSDENYSYAFDGISTWKIEMPIKTDLLANEEISGYIIAKNAYGESDTFDVSIPLLINSFTNLENSTDLKECFSNESFRKFSNVNEEGTWDSTKDITEYDNGTGLMVIPGKGLIYPYGNWASYYPQGSPNYSDQADLLNEKFFVRKFSGNNDIKFGGIFVFEGISEDDLFDERISVIFTNDAGLNWYSLKDIRNDSVSLDRNGEILTATGVMTNVQYKDGKTYVTWSYPKTESSNNFVYLKVGMKPSTPYCIKSIQLLNLDGTEDW